MEIKFTVYPVACLVSYVVEGVAADAEVEAFLNAVLTHRHFRRGFDFLGESQGTHEPDAAFPPSFARTICASGAALGSCRWAVVVAPPRGEALKLEPSGEVEVVSFSTREDAFDWLSSGRQLTPPATESLPLSSLSERMTLAQSTKFGLGK